MRRPIFIRPLSADDQRQIQAGLRSSDAFVMRRCQILRASARGERAPAIAQQLGCDDQTVRNVIHEFNATGLWVLQDGSSRPHRLHSSFSEDGLVRLKTCCIGVHATLAKRAGGGPCSWQPRSASSKASSPPPSPTKAYAARWAACTPTGSVPNTGSAVPTHSTSYKKRAGPLDRLGQPAA